jgi:translocation and assembly module TamA
MTAVVDTRIDRSETASRGRRPVTAVIDVKPGKRYTLADIVINADPTIPPTLIADNFPLASASRSSRSVFRAPRRRLRSNCPKRAIPLPRSGSATSCSTARPATAFIRCRSISAKGRVSAGSRRRAIWRFDAKHVEVLARFKRGDLYDSRKVDDLRQALVATGLFSTVAAEPQPTGENAGDDTEYVTMLVTQQAGPPRTLAASAGYGTGEGIRLEGSWTHRNLPAARGRADLPRCAGDAGAGNWRDAAAVECGPARPHL